MSTDASLRRAPAPHLWNALTAAIEPGGRVAGVRRLRGGIDSGMHAFDLVETDGTRRRLVLRRYDARWLADDPVRPTRLWRTLHVLTSLGVLAPEPVWFDGQGALFGVPALVMTRLPGRGNLRPTDERGWCRQLGQALAAIHAVPIEGRDLSWLPGPEAEVAYQFERLGRADHPSAAYPLRERITDALHYWWPRIDRLAPVLGHGDYWPGNTMWRRGHLTAVVDWDQATVAHPGQDVGYCRLDLALSLGPRAADEFLAGYEAAAGRAIPYLFFWDLLASCRALPSPSPWLPGYHDFGRTDLTVPLLDERLHQFIAGALEASQTA